MIVWYIIQIFDFVLNLYQVGQNTWKFSKFETNLCSIQLTLIILKFMGNTL